MKRPYLILLFLAFFAVGSTACKKKGPTGPTPTPGPTATPTPTPINRPDLNAVCNRIAPGSGGACGPSSTMKFTVQTIASVYQVPGSFLQANGQPKNPKAYIQEIYRRLEQFGLCGVFDGDKLMVRDAGNYAEFYTLNTPYEYRPLVQHESTCAPSPTFATWNETTYNVKLPTCHLPLSGFRDGEPGNTCTLRQDGANPHYEADVNWAIDRVLDEERTNSTGLFDYNDPWDQHFTIKITAPDENIIRYLERIAGHLRSRGYCTYRSSEGLNVKKDSNNFSDFYDLVFTRNGKSWVQRTFHSVCNPAYF